VTAPTTAGPDHPVEVDAGYPGAVPPDAGARIVDRVKRRLAAADTPVSGPAALRAAVATALQHEGLLLPPAQFAAAVRAVTEELTGLGPLAPLLADGRVTDICVNGPGEVWVERDGRLELTSIRFPSQAALRALVQRVVAPLGLRVDDARPWVDARLPGGERFHAVLPPIAPDGPVVTIRSFARERLGMGDLVARGSLDAGTGRLLEAMVSAGIAIVVSGATGTGKTTLLNVLAGAVPSTERIVTVEDAAELKMPGPHIVRLEARPPNVEGRGAVALGELVRNALRMRPDRIVVGEARGGEVLDMLHAANTGHRGLLTTVHAGGADEVPRRLEAMAMSVPGTVPAVVRQLIGAIQAVVHLERTRSGRRVQVVAELCPDPDGLARAIPIRATSPQGGLAATGHTPLWADRLPAALSSLWDPAGSAAGVTALPIRRVTP
jgi:pilus assembly protein CpaF